MPTSQLSDDRRGTLLGVAAYLIWGFAALYWVQTEPVDARDLLAHRALWSLPLVVLCLIYMGRFKESLRSLRNYRALMIMGCAAIFSATNWGIFLWAVTNGKATEASLGYFLLPLLNVVIGLTLFRESIDFPQKLAVAFALMGLVVQLVYYGGLPLVSLGLAFSFGLYGAVRKAVSIGSVEGLFIELLIMAPVAIAWLIYRDGGGMGQYGLKIDMLLVGSSLVTAIPLMCYVAASRLIPLTALGLVFYIGPTTQLLIAVFVFDEVFSNVQFISFGLVWIGLILMTADNFRRSALMARIFKQ